MLVHNQNLNSRDRRHKQVVHASGNALIFQYIAKLNKYIPSRGLHSAPPGQKFTSQTIVAKQSAASCFYCRRNASDIALAAHWQTENGSYYFLACLPKQGHGTTKKPSTAEYIEWVGHLEPTTDIYAILILLSMLCLLVLA